MQDEVAMDVRYRFAELHRQPQLVVKRERRIVVDEVETASIDVLHYDVRHAFRGYACVEQAGDVLVLETSEGIAFEVEVPQCRTRVELPRDELDGDTLGESAGDPAA